MDRSSRRAALEDQAASFPANPGVYLFKDAKGRVLYVGKADLLRDRVRAYFGPSLDVRHVRMVERAERLEYVLTDSVSEAFLLEANLIKQHHPRYNIRLKDDKSYPYVKVTLDEDFPRVLRTRALGDRTARYFGPFANAKSVDQSLDLLQKLFPYRTCKLTILAGEDGRGRTVPPSALPGGRPCLLFHLKRCTAPCVGNTTRDEYRTTVEKSVLFLEGRYEHLARDTRKEMQQASDALAYERAASLRDRLVAIERTLDRQEVHAYKGDDFDVLAAAVDEGDAVVQVFRVRDGTIVSRDHFALEGSEGAGVPEVLASFLKQHYAIAAAVPPEIVIPAAVPDEAAFVAFATERRQGPVHILVPQRGKKRHLAELAERNAKDALEQERVRWLADRGKTEAALSDAGLLQIPMAALAKEREELFVPSRADPIVLPRTSQGLYLVQRIRDEAHRFAVTYHQKVRGKRATRSVLDDVDGVGPARKRALLRRFGSVRAMREAPVADLAAVSGVGSALAERIKQAIET